MAQKNFILIFGILICINHYTRAAPSFTRRSADDSSEEVPADAAAAASARAEFERQAMIETTNFLNGMFRGQINYFGKVKQRLPPQAKRVGDIERYISRLEAAIKAEDLTQKDKMYRDTFTEFSDSVFLLNKQKDTLVSNDKYQEILNESGLEEVTKNFLTEVGTYFLKMARASGKVVEMTIEEHLENLKNEQLT